MLQITKYQTIKALIDFSLAGRCYFCLVTVRPKPHLKKIQQNQCRTIPEQKSNKPYHFLAPRDKYGQMRTSEDNSGQLWTNLDNQRQMATSTDNCRQLQTCLPKRLVINKLRFRFASLLTPKSIIKWEHLVKASSEDSPEKLAT